MQTPIPSLAWGRRLAQHTDGALLMSVVHPVLVLVRASLLADASEPGRSTAFLVLLGFVLSFLFIRMSARMIRAEVSWWPGNVETASGLHLHHLVWGIGLMLVGGFLGFALGGGSPWYQIAALGFGIGCGLTLDEFALWVHLKDVYWSREGRSSLDAVVLTAAFMALVVIGTEPLGLGSAETAPLVVYAVVQALALSAISFLKGRIGLGVLAIFIPLLGLWAAFRLAKPSSPWARRFYDEGKLERSRERFPPDRRGARFRNAFFDAIGGRPSQPQTAEGDEGKVVVRDALSDSPEAVAEVRRHRRGPENDRF